MFANVLYLDLRRPTLLTASLTSTMKAYREGLYKAEHLLDNRFNIKHETELFEELTELNLRCLTA